MTPARTAGRVRRHLPAASNRPVGMIDPIDNLSGCAIDREGIIGELPGFARFLNQPRGSAFAGNSELDDATHSGARVIESTVLSSVTAAWEVPPGVGRPPSWVANAKMLV